MKSTLLSKDITVLLEDISDKVKPETREIREKL